MGREPRDFSIWATIVEQAAGKYLVKVSALAIDLHGPREEIIETHLATSREEAHAARIRMVRDLCDRLAGYGSRIVDVHVDP